MHGPSTTDDSGADLEKMSTASSAETIEEEDGAVVADAAEEKK